MTKIITLKRRLLPCCEETKQKMIEEIDKNMRTRSEQAFAEWLVIKS